MHKIYFPKHKIRNIKLDLKKIKDPTETLKDLIVDACQDIKAKDLVVLNMNNIKEASASFFVICHGDSSTQVNAIASNVLKKVKEVLGQSGNKEGMKNGEWVLVDYGDVVVHVFFKEKRYYYQLEELWGDATLTEYGEEGKEIKKLKSKTKTNARAGQQRVAK